MLPPFFTISAQTNSRLGSTSSRQPCRDHVLEAVKLYWALVLPHVMAWMQHFYPVLFWLCHIWFRGHFAPPHDHSILVHCEHKKNNKYRLNVEQRGVTLPQIFTNPKGILLKIPTIQLSTLPRIIQDGCQQMEPPITVFHYYGSPSSSTNAAVWYGGSTSKEQEVPFVAVFAAVHFLSAYRFSGVMGGRFNIVMKFFLFFSIVWEHGAWIYILKKLFVLPIITDLSNWSNDILSF